MTDQYRIIGQLEAQMDSHQERLDRIETKVDVMLEYIQQQRGGAKLVWMIAAGGGVIGMAVSKLAGMLIAAIRGTT